MATIQEEAIRRANAEARDAAVSDAKRLISAIAYCRKQREELAVTIKAYQHDLAKLEVKEFTAEDVLGS